MLIQPDARSNKRIPVSCNACAERHYCGGLAQPEFWGCFSQCADKCKGHNCDWTCPHNSNWIERIREVRQWPPKLPSNMTGPSEELPFYIPSIHHGSSRSSPAHQPVVALPTARVIKKRRNGIYGRSQKGITIQKEFELSETSKVLLLSVADDVCLEEYWKFRTSSNAPQTIAASGAFGITVPNFSFFTDAPRTHTLWNRARMALVTEELSEAGIGVIPHLNALTQDDWEYWLRVLREFPEIKYVTKEFQTGLATHDFGFKAIKAMAVMQSRLGRRLHPIAIGAGYYVNELRKNFNSFTIIDSMPFMKTIKRKKFGGVENPIWLPSPTQPGESLHILLDENIELHREFLQSKLK